MTTGSSLANLDDLDALVGVRSITASLMPPGPPPPGAEASTFDGAGDARRSP